MIKRIDKIAIPLPEASAPNANAAAALQELMGGKFGEMSTIMNYTFQSFNFRGRNKFRPFYDLVSNIAAEEYSHIEVVSAGINSLLTGTTKRADRNASPAGKEGSAPLAEAAKNLVTSGSTDPAPLADAVDYRNTYHFIASGQQCLPMDSMGRPWTGDNVFCSGNLKLDLLHNFFLECGARGNKMRVYEMTNDPVARAVVGYLLVRGGVHIVAYAKALEVLTGADVSKLLPIPDISNKKFPEARKHEEQGLHTIMYKYTDNDYKELFKIWNGMHPEDGQPLVVKDELPEGFPWPDFEEEPQLAVPGSIDPDMINYYAKVLG